MGWLLLAVFMGMANADQDSGGSQWVWLKDSATGRRVHGTQAEAIRACARLGLRAPTAMEAARRAMVQGAHGILVNRPNREPLDTDQIVHVYAVDETDGVINSYDFYYEYLGYTPLLRPDPRAIDSSFIWTRSTEPLAFGSSRRATIGLMFNTVTGRFMRGAAENYSAAVGCR